MTPLYKDGDRHSPGNYRPVTITSILCRLLEKIVKKRVTDHVVENDIMSDDQHGFRSKRSCMTNLLEALDYITEILDKGWPVDEVFLDYAKAFDKVPHQRLVFKLKKCGIKGELLMWIESFLHGRTQQVKLRNQYSKHLKVTSGVPQGSILGPLLFLLYINDAPLNCNNSRTKIFADDTKLYCKVSSIKESSRGSE